ncbi:hypothetical protein C8J56DRAFT_1170388, partial [Mycena floridula]
RLIRLIRSSTVSRAPASFTAERLDPRLVGELSSFWGSQVTFNQLISAGVLKKQADGTYIGANGFHWDWDSGSSIPFLCNVAKSTCFV